MLCADSGPPRTEWLPAPAHCAGYTERLPRPVVPEGKRTSLASPGVRPAGGRPKGTCQSSWQETRRSAGGCRLGVSRNGTRRISKTLQAIVQSPRGTWPAARPIFAKSLLVAATTRSVRLLRARVPRPSRWKIPRLPAAHAEEKLGLPPTGIISLEPSSKKNRTPLAASSI